MAGTEQGPVEHRVERAGEHRGEADVEDLQDGEQAQQPAGHHRDGPAGPRRDFFHCRSGITALLERFQRGLLEPPASIGFPSAHISILQDCSD